MKKIIELAGAGHLVTKVGDTHQWASTDPSGESGLDASITLDEEGYLSMRVSEWSECGGKNGRAHEDVFRAIIDPDGRIEDYKGEQEGPSSQSVAREFLTITSNMTAIGVEG